jgi:hypothetical protein
VHGVSLRYSTVITPEGTQMFVPNNFFLRKLMVNFSQRPKRAIDLRVRVSPATAISALRDCVANLETILQSLHMGHTSYERVLVVMLSPVRDLFILLLPVEQRQHDTLVKHQPSLHP